MKKFLIIIYLVIFGLLAYTFIVKFSKAQIVKNEPIIIEQRNEESADSDVTTISLSFVGDCTIGWDPRYGYATRFDKYLDDNNGDFAYYFAKVKDYLDQDDITVANLEGQLTTSNDKVEKMFNFKAPTSYVNI